MKEGKQVLTEKDKRRKKYKEQVEIIKYKKRKSEDEIRMSDKKNMTSLKEKKRERIMKGINTKYERKEGKISSRIKTMRRKGKLNNEKENKTKYKNKMAILIVFV